MRSVADEASRGGRGTWKGLQQHTKEFSFDAIGDREPQMSSQQGREDHASLKDHSGHNVKGDSGGRRGGTGAVSKYCTSSIKIHGILKQAGVSGVENRD